MAAQELMGRYLTAGLTASELEAAIRALSVSLKKPVFSAENEWRITWLRGVDAELPIALRNDGTEVISYVEMPLPLRAIKTIVVGTKRDVRRTVESIWAYLERLGVLHVQFEECEIPYR